MTLNEAQRLVERRRPQAAPIPAFMEMLQEYEQTCRAVGAIAASSDEPKVSRKRGPVPRIPQGPPNKQRPRVVVGPMPPPSGGRTSVDAKATPKPESSTEAVVGPSLDLQSIGSTITKAATKEK